jgi:hypothetical protein
MGDTFKSLLPPKKKDWCPGKFQIGIFIRTPKGTSVEFVWDDAPKAVSDVVLDLLPKENTLKKDMPDWISRKNPKPGGKGGVRIASEIYRIPKGKK